MFYLKWTELLFLDLCDFPSFDMPGIWRAASELCLHIIWQTIDQEEETSSWYICAARPSVGLLQMPWTVRKAPHPDEE